MNKFSFFILNIFHLAQVSYLPFSTFSEPVDALFLNFRD
jgi:hypothetical protein